MRTAIILAFVLASAMALAGCSSARFPGVHRITIQQGNVITQTMVDKLRPGMTKSQVRFVLGQPIVDDSLNRDRWDYYYSIRIAGGDPITQTLQLYFVDERLSYFEGDFAPSSVKDDAKGSESTSS